MATQGDQTVPEPVGSPPPSRETPAVVRPSSRRLNAVVEVVLCSGFPTQLLLVAVLGALGLAAVDATGALSLRWVVLLSMADAVLLLGLVFYFLIRNGEDPRELFLGHRPRRREAVLGIALTPVMLLFSIVCVSILHAVWPGIRNVPENPFEALLQSPLNALAFALVAVVAGGIREELQRAFVLRRFEQHLGGVWVGLAVFSVAFGLGHLVQGWDAAIVTALLGALWGLIFVIRRSVVSTVVSHAGFNLSEIMFVLVGLNGGSV